MWNIVTKRQRLDGVTIYADLCCLSRDGQHIGVLRRHDNGACMLTYDMRSHTMKAASTRWRLYAGGMLLTWGACFMVVVEPGCIVVWRLKGDDAVAYSHYMDNQYRSTDDLHYDDQRFCYVHDEGNVSEKQMIRSYADRDRTKLRHLLKISAKPGAVAVTADSQLIVGCSRGRLVAFNLNQLMPPRTEFDGNVAGTTAGQFATVLPEVHHDGHITTVCLSTKSDERYIVCGSADATLSVFDRQLNHRQSILVGHDDQVLCASICPCDGFVASGSSDCSIRLWQLTTGCQLAVFDACVDVYSVVVYRQDDHDGQLRLAALGHRQAARKLMLFRTYNIDTTNAAEQL